MFKHDSADGFRQTIDSVWYHASNLLRGIFIYVTNHFLITKHSMNYVSLTMLSQDLIEELKLAMAQWQHTGNHNERSPMQICDAHSVIASNLICEMKNNIKGSHKMQFQQKQQFLKANSMTSYMYELKKCAASGKSKHF